MQEQRTYYERCGECEQETKVVVSLYNGVVTDGYRECYWCCYFEEFDQWFQVWDRGYRKPLSRRHHA